MCWPDFDDDVAVRMKDAEEMYRFQILIDELAGALPIDVDLSLIIWQQLTDLHPTVASDCKCSALPHPATLSHTK